MVGGAENVSTCLGAAGLLLIKLENLPGPNVRNFLYPLLFSGKLSFGSSSETSISALSVFVRSISSYHLVITHQLKCNCRGLTGLSTGINQTIVLQRTVTMLTMINPTPTGERSTFSPNILFCVTNTGKPSFQSFHILMLGFFPKHAAHSAVLPLAESDRF